MKAGWWEAALTLQDLAKAISPILRTPKNVIRYMSEKTFLEDRLTLNTVNRRKDCYNLNDSTFSIFSDHFEGKWVGKCLF